MKKNAYLVETPGPFPVPDVIKSCDCTEECENCCGGKYEINGNGSEATDDVKQRAFLIRFMEAKKSGDEGKAQAIAREAEKHGIDME